MRNPLSRTSFGYGAPSFAVGPNDTSAPMGLIRDVAGETWLAWNAQYDTQYGAWSFVNPAKSAYAIQLNKIQEWYCPAGTNPFVWQTYGTGSGDPGGYPTLTNLIAPVTADVPLLMGSFVDVASLALGRGTWLVSAHANAGGSVELANNVLRLRSAGTVYAEAAFPNGPSVAVATIPIPLTGAAAINRAGATKNWTGLPALPSTSGTYLPGDKSYLVRQQLVPGGALTAMPTVITFAVRASLSLNDGTQCDIIDDLVQMGPVGGPSSANVAMLVSVDGTTHTYAVPMAGFLLSDLNAGNLYLYLGWRANPTDPNAYNAGNWTLAFSPAAQGLNQSGTVSLNTPYVVMATYTGAAPIPAAVNIQVTSFAQGAGDPSAPSSYYYGTASANDGQGGTDSGVIEYDNYPPNPLARQSTTTKTTHVALSGRVASLTLTPTAISSVTPTRARATVNTSVSNPSVVPPTAVTLTLTSVVATYIFPEGFVGPGHTSVTSIIVLGAPTTILASVKTDQAQNVAPASLPGATTNAARGLNATRIA